MSNTLEDRLTAALHARADLIQPEDLRLLEPIAPRYRARRSVALLAAASIVIAGTIAAVWFTNGNDERLEPSKPMPDGYVEVERLTGYVDGDDRADLIRIGRLADERTVPSPTMLVVDLADRRATAELAAGPVPKLVGLADLTGSGQAIVTRRPQSEGFELVVHVLAGDRLDQAKAGKADAELLRQTDPSDGLGYSVTGGLETWGIDGRDPEKLQRPTVHTWTVSDGRLMRTLARRDRCWHVGEPQPTDCPTVNEVPSSGGYVAGLRTQIDLDGDGTADKIRVSWPQGDVGARDDQVRDTNRGVIVAELSTGGRTGQYLPGIVPTSLLRVDAQRWPRLGGGETPIVAVSTRFVPDVPEAVYGLVDGVLTELIVPADADIDPFGFPLVGEDRWVQAALIDGRMVSWVGDRVPKPGSGTIQVDVYDFAVRESNLIPVKRPGAWCTNAASADPPTRCRPAR